MSGDGKALGVWIAGVVTVGALLVLWRLHDYHDAMAQLTREVALDNHYDASLTETLLDDPSDFAAEAAKRYLDGVQNAGLVREILQQYRRVRPEVFAIRVLDPEGRVVVSSGDETAALPSYVRPGAESTLLSTPYPLNGAQVFDLLVPLRGGGVVVVIDLEGFKARFAAIHHFDGDRMIWTGQNGEHFMQLNNAEPPEDPVRITTHLERFPLSVTTVVDARKHLALWRRINLLSEFFALLLALLGLGAALRYARFQREEAAHRRRLQHSREVLQQQKKKLDALLDGINGVAWEMDLDTMQFTYVSSSAERFLGYPAWMWKDLEFWLSMIVPEDRDQARDYCLNETRQGRDHTFDYRMRRSDGVVIWVLDVVSVICDEQGKPSGLAGFILDISQEKVLQNKLDFFKQVVEHAGEAIFAVEPRTARFFYVNASACRYLGYREEELLGQPVPLVLLPRPDVAPLVWEVHVEEVKARGSLFYEGLHRRKDGTTFPMEATVNYVEHGGDAAIVAFCRDVSTKLAAEAQLRELNQELERRVVERTAALAHQSEKYRTLFNSSSDAFFIHGFNDRGRPTCFSEVNDRACTLLGYTKAELLQMSPKEVTNLNSIADVEAIFKTLHSKGSFINECELKTKTGKTIPVELHSRTFMLDASRHAFTAVRDISQRKNLEARTRRQEQMLIQQSRLAAMGEMIGAIAHQWRQPLTGLGAILINLEDAMEFGELDATRMREKVEQGETLLAYMSQTIDDFRNFFRPDRDMEPFDLCAACGGAMQLVEAQLDHHDITLSLRTDETPRTVRGYPNEFKQVLINLISNAKDAILQRESSGRITLTCATAAEGYAVAVCDNGGGIAPELIDKLFDPYFTTRPTGTGLGLYMAKMIIETSMHGTLRVHNTAEGVCFTITLPVGEEA